MKHELDDRAAKLLDGVTPVDTSVQENVETEEVVEEVVKETESAAEIIKENKDTATMLLETFLALQRVAGANNSRWRLEIFGHRLEKQAGIEAIEINEKWLSYLTPKQLHKFAYSLVGGSYNNPKMAQSVAREGITRIVGYGEEDKEFSNVEMRCITAQLYIDVARTYSENDPHFQESIGTAILILENQEKNDNHGDDIELLYNTSTAIQTYIQNTSKAIAPELVGKIDGLTFRLHELVFPSDTIE